MWGLSLGLTEPRTRVDQLRPIEPVLERLVAAVAVICLSTVTSRWRQCLGAAVTEGRLRDAEDVLGAVDQIAELTRLKLGM